MDYCVCVCVCVCVCAQVRRAGRRDTDVSWEPLSNLRCKEPYVMKASETECA